MDEPLRLVQGSPRRAFQGKSEYIGVRAAVGFFRGHVRAADYGNPMLVEPEQGPI